MILAGGPAVRASNPMRSNSRRIGVAVGLGLALATPLLTTLVIAADHRDGPAGTRSRVPADISDVFGWHTADGKIVAAVALAGALEAGQPVHYGDTVVYGIHLDHDDDGAADHDVWVRFGQDERGAWGVQVTGLPGGSPTVVGPVETVLDAGAGLRVWAGLRDDPFFFDADGLQATTATGALAFASDNDSFAGTNVLAIVVELDAAAALGDHPFVRLWATTRGPQ